MLDRLSPRTGSRQRKRRIGRGPGSGVGKTSGRGIKGQGHRSAGRPTRPGFEGGQMPMVRRIPKRGFKNVHRKPVEAVNLRDLAGFGEGASVDVESLVARGLVKPGRPVKLLAEGDAPRGLQVKVQKVSAAARGKVEAAGGSVEIVA